MNTVTILEIIAGVLIIAGIIILAVSRRSHLRSWRLGVFYESEEHFDKPIKEENEDG